MKRFNCIKIDLLQHSYLYYIQFVYILYSSNKLDENLIIHFSYHYRALHILVAKHKFLQPVIFIITS